MVSGPRPGKSINAHQDRHDAPKNRRDAHRCRKPRQDQNGSAYISQPLGHRNAVFLPENTRLGIGGYAHDRPAQIGHVDERNADCILLWGSNPPAAHPPMAGAIKAGCDGGAKLIVVDPRLSTIAQKADLVVSPKAGTDGALAWGLINILIANDWYDREFVAEQTLGFDKLADYATRFTPAVVEAETGVGPETLQTMATMIHQASPRLAQYVGSGPELYDNSIDTIRAIAYLIALSGSLDVKGGGFLPEPLDLRSLLLDDEIPLEGVKRVDNDKYPVLHDFRDETQTIDAMDAILTGEPYPLKAMIMTGANPALTNPNSAKVERALAGLDLLVVRDLLFLGKRMYNELADSMEKILTNILADRLKKLETADIIEKKPYQDKPVRYAYTLTKRGEDVTTTSVN